MASTAKKPSIGVNPITVLDTRHFRPERSAVMDAIVETLEAAGVEEPPAIRDYGHYRAPNWRDENGALRPHLSVDWYVLNAFDEMRQQVNAAELMESLSVEPWRDESLLGDHYDIILVEYDLFDPREGTSNEYVVGAGEPGIGAVMSSHRFERLDLLEYCLLKTEALHEMGHAFGIPNPKRRDLDLERGLHCSNKCVMRNATRAPDDWQRLTADRLKAGPFCQACIRDLRHRLRRTTIDDIRDAAANMN